MTQRWSGFFETPNQAALLIAVGLVSAAAVMVALSRRPRGALRTTGWCLLLSIQASLALLIAMSGSRAGCAACVSGLLVLLFSDKKSWLTVLPALILVIVAFLVLPQSRDRLPAAAKDLAQGDRVALWRSTLAASVDYPWTGIGGRASSLLEDWYLPDGYSKRFQTSLSDGLTILVRFGYPAFFAVVTLIGLLASSAISSERSWWSASLLALACVHLVAGLFQAHLWYLPTLLCFVLIVVLLALSVWTRIRLRHLTIALAIASLAIGLLALKAKQVSGEFPLATELVDNQHVRAFPRGRREAPTILCQLEDPGAVRRFRHSAIRDVVPDRYAVICCAPGEVVRPSLWNYVSAWHQEAADRWSAARLNRHDDPLYLVNPHGTPSHRGNVGARISLVVTANAPFVPDLTELKESLSEDDPLSSLTVYPAKSSEWRSLVETIDTSRRENR
ncbi:MAG: O-antigen ligase family protein [Planctomycetes bacterium]|nr:O-antigen ligase family protein [Planctomycetota bacterium]